MLDCALVYVLIEDTGICGEICALLQARGLTSRAYHQAADFLAEPPALRPGCLVMDVACPGINPAALAQRFGDPALLPPMVMLIPPGTIPPAIMGLKLGPVDFIDKPVPPDELLHKVQAALEHDIQNRAHLAAQAQIRQRLSVLTARERELLQLVVGGNSNKQVAAQLGLSIKTVENHRAHLMDKMGALNAADLVRLSLSVAA